MRDTSASATTTPPPRGSPACSPASGHSSSTGVPGSTSASRRSRTIILPREWWRSTYCGPPPASTSSCSARTSSVSARMASALARNSSPDVARCDCSTVLTRWCPTTVRASPGRRPCPRRPPARRTALPRSCAASASASAHARSGSVRSSSLVAPTAPGADLRSAIACASTQASSAGLVVDHRREQSHRRRLVRVEALAGQDHAGEEAPVHHAQRRDEDHGRSHADPHLGEGERRCRGSDGHVRRPR